MTVVVLDASALLAYLKGEPGEDKEETPFLPVGAGSAISPNSHR